MTARRPGPAALEGRFVRLEPLGLDDVPELFAAIAHPEVFSGGYGGGPAGYRGTLEAFSDFAETYYQWDEGNVYGVRVASGPGEGLLVGTSTLGDFDLVAESTHIGWTAYDPRVWATAVNPESKLLLLGLAFEHGFERVRIQADALNERSRAAILRLGAQFEGIHRHDRKRADGAWRDTAIYSVLSAEWPAVRAGLEARLAAFDGPVAVGSARAAVG